MMLGGIDRVAPVRFSYGPRVERFERFDFGGPSGERVSSAFQRSVRGWHGSSSRFGS